MASVGERPRAPSPSRSSASATAAARSRPSGWPPRTWTPRRRSRRSFRWRKPRPSRMRPLPGAGRLLDALPRAELGRRHLGRPAPSPPARLRRAGLPVPPVLVCAEDVTRGKPSPDAYLLAARELGVSPPDCLVVEDAPAGVQAARAAGMTVVGLTTTHPGRPARRRCLCRVARRGLSRPDRRGRPWARPAGDPGRRALAHPEPATRPSIVRAPPPRIAPRSS